MKWKSFRGGIHPPDHKGLSADKKIEDLPVPQKVAIPLAQHIGAVCQAKVIVGQRVKKGEVIGDSQSFVSAPIHASISGKVTEIEDYPHPGGQRVPTVMIESDGLDQWFEEPHNGQKPLESSPDELRQRVRQAGIVGLGGATFPAHVKLSPPKEKKIEAVILNGVECEPYLTADHRLMLENTKEIVTGLEIIARILGVEKGYIGIEANKPDALEAMQKATKDLPWVEVVGLKVKYPQGAEKQLIKAVLGREVPPPPGLPMDVGAVIQNVGTAYAIYEAVMYNKPLIERVVTVTGRGIREPKNLRVRLGTLFSEAIAYCGGFEGEVGKIIMGGPMMGLAQHTILVPVIKGTSGILILPKEDVCSDQARHCLNCGMCVRACPMRLMPSLLGTYCERDMLTEAKAAHLFNCVECGSCVYVCPAKRHLVQAIKYGKSVVLAQERASK